MQFFDRDYIKDYSDRFLRVVGNSHPTDSIVSYVKYYPNKKLGTRKISGKIYSYNTHVPKSYIILKNEDNRIIYSEKHGSVITTTPLNKIKKHYSAQKKTLEILQNRKIYLKHNVGTELIKFLDKIPKDNIEGIGVTGSFLIDAYHSNSDIDLVCYDKKTYLFLKKIFNDPKVVTRYEGKLGVDLYNRRMIYMDQIELKTLLKQENRKLQGLLKDTNIHINCQPILNDNYFEDIKILPLGEIVAEAVITDASKSIYSPGRYSIKVTNILESLFPSNKNSEEQITTLLTYLGNYASVFKKGDFVYLDGILIQITKNKKITFGIELTPWNTKKIFKAILLKK